MEAGRRRGGGAGWPVPWDKGERKGPSLFAPLAHTGRQRLVRGPFWEEPVVGVPSEHPACPAGDHPDIHGPADHSCHRQPEGKQAEGKAGAGSRGAASLIPPSQRELSGSMVRLSELRAISEAIYKARRLSSGVWRRNVTCKWNKATRARGT